MVCASADYGIEFQLDSTAKFYLHELDGYPINPVLSERLYLQPGETAVVDIISPTSQLELIAMAGGHHKNLTNVGKPIDEGEKPFSTKAQLYLTPNEFEIDPNNDLPSLDIVNQPYVIENNYEIVTDRERLPTDHYYPSPNDEVLSLQFNTNFAIGPVFNGKKFTRPSVPFTTNGNPELTPCEGDGVQVCTNIAQGVLLCLKFIFKTQNTYLFSETTNSGS